MEPRKDSFVHIAKLVLRRLPAGSRILDFGSGSGDRCAVLQELGYRCSCCDDLQDAWHALGDNREKILAFARERGLDYRVVKTGHPIPFKKDSFDMVMMHDVLEHLHNSPRSLLNALLELVKTNGLLFLTVPNAVNLRKRIDVLRGRTNYPSYHQFFWYPDPWRGHVREYVKNDLQQLCEFLELKLVELRACDHLLRRLPRFPLVKPMYLTLTAVFPSLKDTWLLLAEKPPGWVPKSGLPADKLSTIFAGDDHPLAAALSGKTSSDVCKA